MRKKIFLVVVALLVTSLPHRAVAQATHVYFSGTLAALVGNQVILEGRGYTLAPTLKVVIRKPDASGAFYEYKGTLSDVQQGRQVALKVERGLVIEIEVLVAR